MEAPTPWFLGTNLKVATTTCLAPPCRPGLWFCSHSSSVFSFSTHPCSSTSDLCLGPILSFITIVVICSVAPTDSINPNFLCRRQSSENQSPIIKCFAKIQILRANYQMPTNVSLNWILRTNHHLPFVMLHYTKLDGDLQFPWSDKVGQNTTISGYHGGLPSSTNIRS